MNSWLYKKTDRGLWTTGFYDPCGEWHSDEDFVSNMAAGARVAYLNGDYYRVCNSEELATCKKALQVAETKLDTIRLMLDHFSDVEKKEG